jgi:hypothetical protein
MIAILITAFLAIQGQQALPLAAQQPGTISGVLRNADGRPAVGARVSALAKPDSPTEAADLFDLSSIAQTDEQGRFRLENVPPGEYYIIAGRVDVPTYFPGTSQITAGTIVKVAPAASIGGIDFSMSDSSIRTAATDTFQVALGRRSVPIRVVGENGSKVPANSEAGPVTLEFERAADGAVTTIPVTATSGMLEYLLARPQTEYRVSMRNLPEGYEVKSITDGTQDLTGRNYGESHPETAMRRAALALRPLEAGTNLIYLTTRGFSGPVTVTVGESGPPPANAGGVRVTGMIRPRDTHPVYISGTAGIVYADGTFEFRNVPPGLHTIASFDLPGRARGTTVVVGDQDLRDVALTDVTKLPINIRVPSPPGPAAGRPAGSTLAPVTLRLRVIEEKSKLPPPGGELYINDRESPPYSLDAEGSLTIQNLLPGVYTVEIQMFGYSTVSEEITVGIEDLNVELTSRKLY